jgi:hypothetical protein
LSSYPPGNLAGMTKRHNSSPYPHPPTEFCRELMNNGWRRCYAEAIDVTRLALAHVDDAKDIRTWAARAAKALANEPVLAGAVHRLTGDQAIAVAAFRLLIAAPQGQGLPLARFFDAAARASQMERLLEQRYLDQLDDECEWALD